MLKKPSFILLTFCLSLCLIISSCGEVDITNLDPSQFPSQTNNNTGSSGISYSSDLIPQFQAGCSCHSNGSSLGNLQLDVYSSITGNIDGQSTSRVNLVTPSNSFILTYPNGGSHTGPTMPPASQLYQDLLQWIDEEDALNN